MSDDEDEYEYDDDDMEDQFEYTDEEEEQNTGQGKLCIRRGAFLHFRYYLFSNPLF